MRLCAHFVATRMEQRIRADIDVGAEIGASALHGLAEIGKRARRVRACVANKDIAATPSQQFVQPKILEVAAVGKMNACVFLVESHAQHFAHHEVIPGRPAQSPRFIARVGHPDAEPDVQQRHEKTDRAGFRRVGIRIHRRARHGEGGRQRELATQVVGRAAISRRARTTIQRREDHVFAVARAQLRIGGAGGVQRRVDDVKGPARGGADIGEPEQHRVAGADRHVCRRPREGRPRRGGCGNSCAWKPH